MGGVKTGGSVPEIKSRTARSSKAAELLITPGILPAADSALCASLAKWKSGHEIVGKGQIATMIYASRLARNRGLPFDTINGIRTDGEGQVKGLGKSAVQKILRDYGVTLTLAEEAGRTSRGSLGNIRAFMDYLNDLHDAADGVDASAVEAWWIDQAKAFFNARPFALRFEAGKSLRTVIRDLVTQAKKRQDESAGTMFVGAMLQHLIGAKLEIALGEPVAHHGFSVADAPGGRTGDFEIGNASIHVTTSPGEAVIRKCVENLNAGREPIIVTVYAMLPIADFQATQLGIADKIDVLDAEQFIVANLHEFGSFKGDQRRVSVETLVDKYNEIIDANETDPSLKISKG